MANKVPLLGIAPLRVVSDRSHEDATVMLRSHYGRVDYMRLDSMANLEQRLVRKLGTSKRLREPQRRKSNFQQIALYWLEEDTDTFDSS